MGTDTVKSLEGSRRTLLDDFQCTKVADFRENRDHKDSLFGATHSRKQYFYSYDVMPCVGVGCVTDPTQLRAYFADYPFMLTWMEESLQQTADNSYAISPVQDSITQYVNRLDEHKIVNLHWRMNEVRNVTRTGVVSTERVYSQLKKGITDSRMNRNVLDNYDGDGRTTRNFVSPYLSFRISADNEREIFTTTDFLVPPPEPESITRIVLEILGEIGGLFTSIFAILAVILHVITHREFIRQTVG